MMEIKYRNEADFNHDFLPLIAELVCGRHYDPGNEQHVVWLRRTIGALYARGGTAICLYADDRAPMGFLLIVHDRGLEGVACFGKVAAIETFGLFPPHRSKGLGGMLLREAESYVERNGGECIYVNTYAGNTGAIRYYTQQGFIPVAYHPGENGLNDKGQVYLYKELRKCP